ncbi:MAG: cell division protein FtsQ/DivIB [Proteobacteria bacterium]|nr:cell division protein FtsQ/DivIB [Pseudomonadota bacterium]
MRLLNPLAWWRDDESQPNARPKARRTPAKRPGPRTPKRGARQADTRHLWQRGGIVLAAGLVLAGMGWLWTSGWILRSLERAELALLAATAEAGLELGDVLVEGRERTERRVVLETLGVVRGQPILAFDPYAAQARLERLPWVRSAAVERRLPAAIHVRLIERRPLALWQYQGRISVIDQGGEVIPGIEPKAFTRLLLVVGKDAPDHTPDLLAMLNSEPELRTRVSAAVRVRGRRWNLRLDDGIDVRLPEQDPAAAWAELARVQREHGVLDRDVAVIDLRLPDRLVVRTTSEAAPKRAPGRDGEET